jgi:hypothetical protein
VPFLSFFFDDTEATVAFSTLLVVTVSLFDEPFFFKKTVVELMEMMKFVMVLHYVEVDELMLNWWLLWSL